MSWESRERGGSYYTRTRRESGRVIREYIGCGPTAELIAEHDAMSREIASLERTAIAERQAADAELERAVVELDRVGELMARMALLAAGYHRHHGGEWRKRRAS